MKNVVNWTIGSFFRTIGRVIAYIIVGALVAFALSYKPKAATLTSKRTYPEGYLYAGDITSLGSNGTYSYSLAPLSTIGQAYFYVGNIGSTAISGKAYYLSFGFQTNLTAQKYYDITINFRDRDLTNNVNTSSIILYSGSSSTTLTNTNTSISLIGVTNTATSGNNTNKLVIRIYANQPTTYWAIDIVNDPNNLTSVNNFGVSSLSINEVDTTNSQEIINNQINNTQNIINNQDNNTQQIIDNQNELLGTKCSNLFNSSWEQGSIGGSGAPITSGQSVRTSTISTISISPNTQYTVSVSSSVSINEFWANYYSDSTFISRVALGSGTTKTFTTPSNANKLILRLTTASDSLTPSNISKTMLVEGSSSKTYCEYGSYISKLDDTTNAINGVNDTLTDDTTPDSDINSALNNIDVPQTSYGPFQAFLTIPLQWVQTILAAGQTCQTLHLPLPFVNKNLDLPCMTDFWSATGVLGVLIQALWIAVVAVRIFNGLFMLTVETLNTNPDSAMELTKIKSWEL